MDDVFRIHTLSKQQQTQLMMGLSDLQIHLMRYMQIGGFPELVKTEDVPYAQKLIREDVMDRAIKHDLPRVHDIRSIDELEKVSSICVITPPVSSILKQCAKSLMGYPALR